MGSASSGRAQVPPSPPTGIPVPLPPLEAVVAHPEVSGAASAVVVDLDSTTTEAATSVSDMLRLMPLVRVRDNSRGETQVALRGSESRQVAVLLDGIPLTLGWDNRTDLSVVPLTGATRVRATRGLSSLLAGPNVLGGVVEIDVMPGPGSSRGGSSDRVRVAGGTGGSLAADVALRRTLGGNRSGSALRAGGGYRRWDWLSMPSGIPQGPLTGPDRRLNSDLEQWNAFLAGRFEGASGRWLGVSSVAFGAERGVPPELHVEEPRLWRLPATRRWVTIVGGGSGWTLGGGLPGSATLTGAVDLGSYEIEQYASASYETVTAQEMGNDRTLTLKADAGQQLGWGALGLSLTGAETVHDETLEPGEESRYRQRLFSGAAELGVPLLRGPSGDGLDLVVGGSVDGSDTPETGGQESRSPIWDWGALVAASLDIPAVDGAAHVGVSRRTRAPSLRELYSGALGRFEVNPNLGPETLRGLELGLTGRSGVAVWQVVAFHHRLSGAIVRTTAGDGTYRRENEGEVRATGVELMASQEWRFLALEADLTVQDVGKFTADGRPDGNPEYQPSLAGSLGIVARLPAELFGRLDVSYVGARYCVNPDIGRGEDLAGAAWTGLRLSRSWLLGSSGRVRGLEISLGVRNLTDAGVYEQCGLPAPGRQLIVAVGFG